MLPRRVFWMITAAALFVAQNSFAPSSISGGTVATVSISSSKLKKGKVGKSYAATLKAVAGSKPYTWFLVSGNLPTGLNVDASTGKITGKPVRAGNHSLTFQVTDSLGQSDLKTLSLLIAPTTTLSSTGRGFGSAVQYLVPEHAFLTQTAIGDLNGDGRNDVVVASLTAATVRVYYQNASGGLDAPTIIPLGLDTRLGGISVAVGDVNGDGKADLVVTGGAISSRSGWCGRLIVFYQDTSTGELLPGEEHVVTTTWAAGAVRIGDLNSDGRNDVVVLSNWTFATGLGNLSIFYQNADGTLAPETLRYDFPVRPSEMAIADLNNDGRNDLILRTGLLQFAVVKQLPDGTLSATPEYYSVQTSYWTSFSALAVGDVNGDGLNDVVTLDPGNQGLLNVFLQNQQGTLDPAVLLVPWGDSPCGIEIADIDGDGLNDIVGDRVEADASPFTGGEVRVLYQRGDHTFEPSTTYGFPTGGGGGCIQGDQALSIGDVTGDGKPDAVVSWSDEGVYVLPHQ